MASKKEWKQSIAPPHNPEPRRKGKAEVVSLVRVKLSRLEAKTRRRLAPVLRAPLRSEEPYASHLPVLVGLAVLLRPRSVLELGAGLHSTPAFLNRNLFPSLEYLRSLENDVEWLDRVRNELPNDSRLDLISIEGHIDVAVDLLDIGGFDMVFIDDSVVAPDRVASIAAVAPRLGAGTVAIIHDFEVQPYREAALRFDHRLTFDAHNPYTGVCWNNGAAPSAALKRLRAELKRLSGTVPMTDCDAWRSAVLNWQATLP